MSVRFQLGRIVDDANVGADDFELDLVGSVGDDLTPSQPGGPACALGKGRVMAGDSYAFDDFFVYPYDNPILNQPTNQGNIDFLSGRIFDSDAWSGNGFEDLEPVGLTTFSPEHGTAFMQFGPARFTSTGDTDDGAGAATY